MEINVELWLWVVVGWLWWCGGRVTIAHGPAIKGRELRGAEQFFIYLMWPIAFTCAALFG